MDKPPKTRTRLWLHRLRRRGKIVGAVVVVLVISSTCTVLRTTILGRMSFAPPAPKAVDHLRLMTFNIAHGRGLAVDQRLVPDSRFRGNLDNLSAFVDETGADIVALQEVDEKSSWNGSFNHLTYIRDRTDLDHAAFGLNNQNGGRYKLNYGNGILSRFPIVAKHQHAFGNATIGEKGFLYTRLEVNGAPLDLINVHLDFRTEKRRIQQVQQIIAFIHQQRDEDPENFILPFIVGDFNSEVTHVGGCVSLLLEELKRLGDYTVVPETGTYTFSVYHPSSTNDHVFVPPTFIVQEVQVPPVRLSDHLPVIVDLLPAPPETAGEAVSQPASKDKTRAATSLD